MGEKEGEEEREGEEEIAVAGRAPRECAMKRASLRT